MSNSSDEECVSVRPYHWDHMDIDETQNIQMWCMNEKDESVLVRIEDWPASFVVELPQRVQLYGEKQRVNWNTELARLLYSTISDKIDRSEGEGMEPFGKYSFVKLFKLYYFSRRQVPCLVLRFKSKSLMYTAYRTLKNYPVNDKVLGSVMLTCHELSINSVRKLITQRQLKYASWISFSDNDVEITGEDKISTCKHEYIVPWMSLNSCEDKGIPKAGILSFDIECYTHDYRIFPRKSDVRHVAYMISCVYHKLQTDEYHRYGIIYGECNEIDPKKFKNTTLIKVMSETEMVQEFANIINKHDPEIITGYNILGFDYPYLDERLNLDGGEWPVMGRLKNVKSYIPPTRSWSSNAYGFNLKYNLIMPGRMNIDMMDVVKRQFTRFSSYKLNSVCAEILGEAKFDVSPREMFEAYDFMFDALFAGPRPKEYVQAAKDKMTEVMLYCIQDSELPIRLMKKMNTWIASLENSSIMGINIYDLYTRGQQVRSESQIYDFAYHHKYLFEKREEQPDIPFDGGFVNPPSPGLWEDVLVIDFASLYPTIMDGYNICYTTLIRDSDWKYIVAGKVKGITVDDCLEINIDCTEVEEDENEEGAEMLDPEEQVILKGEKKVYTFRFVKKHIKEGILPILVRQLCNERKRVRSQIQHEDEKDYTMEEIILHMRQLSLKISCNSMYGLLGVKNHGRLPLIEGAVCITKLGREMIGRVNEYIVAEHDCTVVYGDTDSTMPVVPKETRDVFPAKDYDEFREMIVTKYKTEREIEDYIGCEFCKYHINYKDDEGNYKCPCNGLERTDEHSCECWKTTDNAEVCKYWGERLSEEVTNLFPHPILMEYEKGFSVFLSIKKKKYAGVYLGQEGVPIEDCKMLFKGIILARRDNCKWLKKVYENILRMCMVKEKFEDVLEYLVEELENLHNGGVNFEDLMIVKKMGHNYKKTSTYHMKLFKEEMDKIGKPIEPGARVFYLVSEKPDEFDNIPDKNSDRVFIKQVKKYKLGHKQVTREMYEENLDTEDEYKIDYHYYVGNLLAHHVDQLISIVYKEICDHITAARVYTPTSRHKPRTIHNCIKMFHTMKLFGSEPREFLDKIREDNIFRDYDKGLRYRLVDY